MRRSEEHTSELQSRCEISYAVFWKTENRSDHPLVATHLLKERSTWGLLLTTLLTMTGVFAIMNGILPVWRRKNALT